ncbi:hypothetical protein N7474_002747 [Penicillium riverlandense]|uniref:uncharacterized protein n=1 Tax=Penicillium riverlandense TaxID=1903569 RepID=UPI002548857A|nr:uncharacterized protein N7474_002747 [Penicillium riverlandense]KAJ5825609.1 hypothetical protein N7474_002747 [Penicillium riverlandense]
MAAPLSNLFNRTLFWVSSYVTGRATLKELIKNNGGVVVLNPKDADIRLVNPDKRGHDVFLDTYSYKWVEDSLKKGQLEPFEPYRVGPSAPRPMGASYIARKATRTGFTLKDDQLLFDWVAAYRKITGTEGGGNSVYQELERYYPQHPWQSWRTRYVKKIRGSPRPGGGEPRPIEELHPAVQSRREPAARAEEPQPEGASSRYPKRKRDSDAGHAPSPKRISAGAAAITATSTTHESPHEIRETRPRSPSLVIPSPRNYHPRPSQPAPTHPTQSSHAVEAATTQSKPPLNDPAISAAFLLELPFFPSPPEPEEDDEETEDEDEDVEEEEWADVHDLNSWIDSRIVRRGVDESEVIDTLRRTSMNPIIADKVLKLIAAGQDIPTDMPGFWTPEDDQCLEGGDKYGVERVLKKHGDEAVTTRWEYLSMARDKGKV